MKTVIFGNHEADTLRQFHHCLQTGNVVGGVLCADGIWVAINLPLRERTGSVLRSQNTYRGEKVGD